MRRVFQAKDFIRYNGFYGKPYCRQVVRDLYMGVCASCNRSIEGERFHVAHIIPRSQPDLMEEYFPSLNIDNLLNLKLSCPGCNQKEGNFVVNELPLHNAFTVSARTIFSRFDRVMSKLQRTVKRVEIHGADPRICTDVLYISIDEIRSFATDWLGAVRIRKADLDSRIREAMICALGEEAGYVAVYETVNEAISYFRDHFVIDDGGYSIKSVSNRPWLAEVKRQLHGESHCAPPCPDAVQKAGLIHGVYLDRGELDEHDGLWIPLRTESQRWLREVMATILLVQRKLDANDNKRYLVLAERVWSSLQHCFENLSLIESGIGKVGRRLNAPAVVTSFVLYDDELLFGDEDLEISEEVKRICRGNSANSTWGEGVLVHKSKLKSWLARAFSLTERAAQQISGPRLIRIGDEKTQYRWVPPLPNLVGKTREEVALERPSKPLCRRRRRTSAAPA